MTQLVSKPDLGEPIGEIQGKPVYSADPLQRYLDEIEATLNNMVLGDAVILQAYTVANVPTAAKYENGIIIVTDEAGGLTLAYSDGSDWRRAQDRAIIS